MDDVVVGRQVVAEGVATRWQNGVLAKVSSSSLLSASYPHAVHNLYRRRDREGRQDIQGRKFVSPTFASNSNSYKTQRADMPRRNSRFRDIVGCLSCGVCFRRVSIPFEKSKKLISSRGVCSVDIIKEWHS